MTAGIDYVFGYGSLVALREPLSAEPGDRGRQGSPAVTSGGGRRPAAPTVPGRLVGFRRLWGAAMDNWDPVNDPKHFLDPRSRERPRVRVAYLDIEPSEGQSLNGVAIPVDGSGLALLDAREVNYARVDVSDAFEPALARVFAYFATDAARERCRAGAAESNICVSAEYVARVREAFAGLGGEGLAEFDRTTEPLPFPERDLEMALNP